MSKEIKHIVIVGGGTAGWITAGVIAADHLSHTPEGLKVTLIESPDVPIIGVGEGTWPTMRGTLRKMGISETEFFRECDASFKQGAKFAKWVTGTPEDYYYHPLVLPEGYADINLAPYWHTNLPNVPFADAVSFQGRLCEQHLAPKQNTTPEYAHVANYAYHLDAGKFSTLLQRHCTTKLGVNHILDHVTGIISADDGDIAALQTANSGELSADLFIDCTGFKSMLLGEHYGVEFVDKKHILFNDTALATHVPYINDNDPIASHTISTGQKNGWVWDIGLPTRRGVGHVYSSAHTTDAEAEVELRNYIRESIGDKADELTVRKIDIRPGHREKFWHKNVVAVGLSAGFLEPLEASALVLVELSAQMISEQLPATRPLMDVVAKRFNDKFLYRWDRIIDFLKLHYILTKRTDTQYWIDHCHPDSIPEHLQEMMSLWEYHSPWHQDFTQTDEVFPSASYQYVLYGMGFATKAKPTQSRADSQAQKAQQAFMRNEQLTAKLVKGLTTNRELINTIRDYGLPTK